MQKVISMKTPLPLWLPAGSPGEIFVVTCSAADWWWWTVRIEILNKESFTMTKVFRGCFPSPYQETARKKARAYLGCQGLRPYPSMSLEKITAFHKQLKQPWTPLYSQKYYHVNEACALVGLTERQFLLISAYNNLICSPSVWRWQDQIL